MFWKVTNHSTDGVSKLSKNCLLIFIIFFFSLSFYVIFILCLSSTLERMLLVLLRAVEHGLVGAAGLGDGYGLPREGRLVHNGLSLHQHSVTVHLASVVRDLKSKKKILI